MKWGTDVVMNMMPQAGIFAGINAKTANKLMLQRAQEMTSKGADRKEIWNKTGWYKDIDGKWKFEIDDSKSFTNPIQKKRSGVPLPEAVTHKELYENYPRLEKTMLRLGQEGTGGSYGQVFGKGAVDRINIGEFSSAGQVSLSVRRAKLDKELDAINKKIGALNKKVGGALEFGSPEYKEYNRLYDLFQKKKKDFGRSKPGRKFAPERSLSLHEIQHNVQNIEGFAPGGRPSSGGKLATERYRRKAGEAEARNVETRRDFTAKQRRERPPWSTLDVPEEDLLVRMLTGR